MAHRLGCKACEPHTCPCGKAVDARGLYGLCCWRSGPRHQRHHQMNNIVWKAITRAQIPATRVRQSHTARWKTSRWHHNDHIATLGTRQAHSMGRHSSWHLCWVAHRSDCQRSMLSCKQGSSEQDCKLWHALCLWHCLQVAVETADSWNQSAIELIQEIGRCITAVMEDTREAMFLFQCLAIALQSSKGKCDRLLATFDAVWYPVVSLFLLSLIFTPAALCWWA